MKFWGYVLQLFAIVAALAAGTISLVFGIILAVGATTTAGLAWAIVLAALSETIGGIVGLVFWLPGRAMTEAAEEIEQRQGRLRYYRRHL